MDTDEISNIPDQARCAMCGAVDTGEGYGAPPDKNRELLDGLQTIWLECGEKALDLIFARKTFPHANQRTLAEFLAISPSTVCRTIKQITKLYPNMDSYLKALVKIGYQGNQNARKGKG